jgi:hypothetical protein
LGSLFCLAFVLAEYSPAINCEYVDRL